MKRKSFLISHLILILTVLFLTVQTGCKKDDDNNEPTVQGYGLIGTMPDSPFFNTLKSKISIGPLSSNAPILINPDAVASLTKSEKDIIVMAYRKGMPITIFNPDQSAATKLVELTGHSLPIIYDSIMPEKVMAIGVALLPSKITKYTVQDELQDAGELDFSVQLFLDWVTKALDESNQYQLKGINTAQNLDSLAMMFENTHQCSFDGATVQVTGTVQAIYSCADNGWFLVNDFQIAVNPTNMENTVSLQTGGINFTEDTGYAPTIEVFEVQPATTTSTETVSNSIGLSFTAGVSFNIVGPTVSFSATASYNHTWGKSIPNSAFNNDSNISTGFVSVEIGWNQQPADYISYPVNWYWIVPYNESAVGSANLQGLLILNAATGDTNIPLSQYTFSLPEQKCSD